MASCPILGISDSSANVIKITYYLPTRRTRGETQVPRYSSDFSGCLLGKNKVNKNDNSYYVV